MPYWGWWFGTCITFSSIKNWWRNGYGDALEKDVDASFEWMEYKGGWHIESNQEGMIKIWKAPESLSEEIDTWFSFGSKFGADMLLYQASSMPIKYRRQIISKSQGFRWYKCAFTWLHYDTVNWWDWRSVKHKWIKWGGGMVIEFLHSHPTIHGLYTYTRYKGKYYPSIAIRSWGLQHEAFPPPPLPLFLSPFSQLFNSITIRIQAS